MIQQLWELIISTAKMTDEWPNKKQIMLVINDC